ncbi:MAG: biphenyl 2,3-dioxygenase [Rhodospirillaceae bacterium]|nr:biphenyl 2,3-dioxygenase [Rhodospirillaceae bacterium]|tara:strand:- start:1279 stop:1668 length:390 start_codon:yes stop_codon:yes gene_type:complete
MSPSSFLSHAYKLISTDEACRSCVITDPNQPDNPITYVTADFEKQTGYKAEEVIGRNCRFLQGPETNPNTVNEIRQALEVGEPVKVKILNYTRNGNPFWNTLSIRPSFDENSKIRAFVAVQMITLPETG